MEQWLKMGETLFYQNSSTKPSPLKVRIETEKRNKVKPFSTNITLM